VTENIKIARAVVERYLEAASPTYTAIFLDEGSKRRLLMWWRMMVRVPLLPTLYADHVTLRFKPSKAEVERTPVGEHALVQVIGFAADEKGQAVLVRPSVSSANHFPHVTVATAKGINPVYSNQLLAEGYSRKQGPILRGIVDYR
jgi:hypothetical protein